MHRRRAPRRHRQRTRVYAGFIHGFMFGDAFDKGLTFRMGQTHVHAWLPDLLALIEQGLLTPEEIVTHHMPLEEAARAIRSLRNVKRRAAK